MDEATAHVASFADAAENEIASVVGGMWNELRRFGEDGPSEEELAQDVEGFRKYFLDPRSAGGVVSSAAARHLEGLLPQDTESRLRELEAVAPKDLANALRPALASRLVLVPEAAPPLLPGVQELPEGTTAPVTGRTWRRRLRSGMPRGARLVTSTEGVSLLIAGSTMTVRYNECVGVGVGKVTHRHLELTGTDGMTLPVCEEDWRDGDGLMSDVEAAVTDIPRYVVELDE